MKMIEVILMILLCVSLTIIYFAYKQYIKTQNLLATGIKTKAKVIDVIRERSDDDYMFRPVFQYQDRSGETIVFKSSFSSRPAMYKIGDMAQILYSKKGDERKIVSFWNLYLWPVLLLCFAIPLLIISISYFIYTMR